MIAAEMVKFGGADRDRTDDLLNAIQALSQLSYSPTREAVSLTLAPQQNSTAERGAFYYDSKREKSEGRQAKIGERGVLALAFSAQTEPAGFVGVEGTAAAASAGREAGAGRER